MLAGKTRCRRSRLKLTRVEKGAQSQARPLATCLTHRPQPTSLAPRRMEAVVRTATYALSCAQFPLPACCAQGLVAFRSGRGAGSPQPRPGSSVPRAATFPGGRARRAHQTCSTFSQPPTAVTLPPSVRPGPAGPTEVAITTGRNAPTYTKPAGPGGHAAPGRAPRPLRPLGAKTRAAAPRPAGGRAGGTHNERDGAVFAELLRPPAGPLSAAAAGGCCVGSVVLP